MSDSFEKYQQLVTSSAQLAECRASSSVNDFFARVKRLWQEESMSDRQLLDELHQCNQRPLNVDVQRLHEDWLPCRYHPKRREIAWCLRDGRATEPFMDQYIDRCRQQVLANHFFSPRVSIEKLLDLSSRFPDMQPAGFIFHLSRCGSTLISGAFAEIENCDVLSESPLLTDVLLDLSLSLEEKSKLLPILIYLQGRACSGKKSIVIKWNAWDIYWWPLIRQLYPQVPVIFLTRDPIEILASHQRLAGRHMSGDPSLFSVDPVFANSSTEKTLLDFRIAVLGSLLNSMLSISDDPRVLVLDYSQVDIKRISETIDYFGVSCEADEYAAIYQRMTFHSKEPGKKFQSDTLQKRQVFSPQDEHNIRGNLMPAYDQLVSTTKNIFKETVHAQ